MDSIQFVYWLQGFAELNQGTPTDDQWKSIKDHLELVLTKVTPNQPMVFPPTYQLATYLPARNFYTISDDKSNLTC